MKNHLIVLIVNVVMMSACVLELSLFLITVVVHQIALQQRQLLASVAWSVVILMVIANVMSQSLIKDESLRALFFNSTDGENTKKSMTLTKYGQEEQRAPMLKYTTVTNITLMYL
jgi:hypothetical protein